MAAQRSEGVRRDDFGQSGNRRPAALCSRSAANPPALRSVGLLGLRFGSVPRLYGRRPENEELPNGCWQKRNAGRHAAAPVTLLCQRTFPRSAATP